MSPRHRSGAGDKETWIDRNFIDRAWQIKMTFALFSWSFNLSCWVKMHLTLGGGELQKVMQEAWKGLEYIHKIVKKKQQSIQKNEIYIIKVVLRKKRVEKRKDDKCCTAYSIWLAHPLIHLSLSMTCTNTHVHTLYCVFRGKSSLSEEL